jgi:pimeloyl-ACP methyl ester carboxylesterase
MRPWGKCAAILLCLSAAACSGIGERKSLGPRLSQDAGWTWENLDGGRFRLASAVAPVNSSPRLVVYLEGDGFAYVRPSRPSQDPTPADPVALRLALSHPRTADPVNVAWLGRPCQYVASDSCASAYWTGLRYAPEILDSIGAAIDQLKNRTHAGDLVLVGYSGGGAIAVLLAARRHDVKGIVTVAADLDLAYWTKRHGLSPLTGSLDPADAAASLGSMPQIHFTGGRDDVIGTDVVRSYLRRLPSGAPAKVIEIPDFTHSCCWSRDWPDLVKNIE